MALTINKRREPTMKAALLMTLAASAVAWPCCGQTKIENSDLEALVGRERAFARTSVAKGARAAFIEFFADDGIVFRPHPAVYKDMIKNVPPPANPSDMTLNWEPTYADVSQAGDLGYTTGPYTLVDNTEQKRPDQRGYFFSIWRCQVDGVWKVVLDLGIKVPEPFRQVMRLETSRSTVRHKFKEGGPEKERQSLLERERQFLSARRATEMPQVFVEFAGDDIRVYRQDEQPIKGKEAVRLYFLRKPFQQTWEARKAEVAGSADLGYTYGNYELRDQETNVLQKGYYTRVWKRDAAGEWKIVFDISSPLPAERPKQ